jgi:hypothetical protein
MKNIYQSFEEKSNRQGLVLLRPLILQQRLCRCKMNDFCADHFFWFYHCRNILAVLTTSI